MKMRYVGKHKSDELQTRLCCIHSTYTPETWAADSVLHIYENSDYGFLFIEELADSDQRITCNPFGGMFHVLVGNFSEVYATLEEAEVSLKEQIGGE